MPPVPRVRFEQPAPLDHIPPDLSNPDSRTYRRYMRTHLRKREERAHSRGEGEAPWLASRADTVQAITGTICTGAFCRGANSFSFHCGRRPPMCRKCCSHMEMDEGQGGACKEGKCWEDGDDLHHARAGKARGSRY